MGFKYKKLGKDLATGVIFLTPAVPALYHINQFKPSIQCKEAVSKVESASEAYRTECLEYGISFTSLFADIMLSLAYTVFFWLTILCAILALMTAKKKAKERYIT